MDQTSQPKNNQSENKSFASVPPVPPNSSTPLVPTNQINDNNLAINMNTQHSGQQFKLSTNEVQGPKPPLVGGQGSKFALIAAISILIIIAGIGGYYIYSKDSIPEPSNSPAAVLPTATPVIDKNLDSDKDGLPDAIEKVLGTYMTKADTDGDGFNDLQEIKSGYSPLISGGVGKYSPQEWDLVKGKIKIEDREFYEREFEAPVLSPSPAISLSPSPSSSQAPVSFICGTSIVKDVDNNIYNTVKIGEQCWLKENLKVGIKINGSVNAANNGIIEKYCYDNADENCATGGGLYQWNEAMGYITTSGAQGICPVGWHIPKDSEWYILENGLKDEGQTCDANRSIKYEYQCNTAGIKLKIGGISGFDSILSGFHLTDGAFGNPGIGANFWSSTENGTNVWNRYLEDARSGIERSEADKADGFSVRCLKD